MMKDVKEHHWIWISCGVTVVLLMILGVILFKVPTEDERADALADEVIQLFRGAGFAEPDHDSLTSTFGDDGGALCEAAESDLGLAELNQSIANGAAQVGVRPVVIAQRVLQGEFFLVQVYCPDSLATFNDYMDGLSFDDVIKE